MPGIKKVDILILYAKDNLIEFYILTTIINKEYETKENTITA